LRSERAAVPSAPVSSPRSWHRASLAMRDLIGFQCDQCKRKNYTSSKNKKRTTDKLSLRKFCPSCRTHTLHKETKL
jgi:large subunit ribosomal protein L33